MWNVTHNVKKNRIELILYAFILLFRDIFDFHQFLI